MKKNKIAALILSTLIFSGYSYALEQVEQDSETDVINQLLNKINNKAPVLKEKEPQKNIVSEAKNEVLVKEIIKEEKQIKPITKSEQIKEETLLAAENLISDENSVETVKASNTEENIEFNEKDLEKKYGMYNNVFLFNIPLETKIYANKDILIFPHREFVMYDNGNLISTSPIKNEEKTTFCYIEVNKQGNFRRIPASMENDKNPKYLTIKGVEANLSTQTKKSEVSFIFENDHIKALTCVTTEDNHLLKIEDIQKETGYIFRYSFPEIIDVL